MRWRPRFVSRTGIVGDVPALARKRALPTTIAFRAAAAFAWPPLLVAPGISIVTVPLQPPESAGQTTRTLATPEALTPTVWGGTVGGTAFAAGVIGCVGIGVLGSGVGGSVAGGSGSGTVTGPVLGGVTTGAAGLRTDSQSGATLSALSAWPESVSVPQTMVSTAASRVSNVSLPAPPSRWSAPVPPVRVSSPGPPITFSGVAARLASNESLPSPRSAWSDVASRGQSTALLPAGQQPGAAVTVIAVGGVPFVPVSVSFSEKPNGTTVTWFASPLAAVYVMVPPA